MCQFEQALNSLLKQDKYIARSDYKDLRDNNSYIFSHFKVLRDSKTLSFYCREHGIEEERIIHFLSNYEDLLNDDSSQLIINHNSDYISGGTPLVNPIHMQNEKICPDFDFSVSDEKLKEKIQRSFDFFEGNNLRELVFVEISKEKCKKFSLQEV